MCLLESVFRTRPGVPCAVSTRSDRSVPVPVTFIRPAALVGLVVGSAALAGCQGGKGPPPQMPPPRVTVAKPATASVQSYYEYNGYLDSVEKFEARARVRGFLKTVSFTEGEEVVAGKLLYEIDPREYQANVAKSKADIAKSAADIENAKAQIRLAESELQRTNKAIESGAAPKTDQDKAVATLAAGKAQLDVAGANRDAAAAALQTAQLDLGYTEIRSPIAGRISRTLVTKGNLVGQGETTLLTTVVSVDSMFVYFDVPERDLVERQRAISALPANETPSVVPVDIGVATEEGYPHRGQIDFRENRADPGTGTVRVRGRVSNPAIPPHNTRLLYPGLYARVRVPVGTTQTRFVIPEDALMTGQEGRYVYVVGADNKVVKRVVTVGTQVFRAPPQDPKVPPAWVLTPPPQPAGGPPSGPPTGGPPMGGPPPGPPPGPAAVRSVVAVESGLAADDVIVVDGLQKAQMRPGGDVWPELWQFAGPPAGKE